MFPDGSGYDMCKYIRSNMAIIGEINKAHPELIHDIIPIITKETDEGSIKEEEKLLKSYGFYKGKTRKKTESIGIGLALSKSIVETYEGIIEVKSKVNKGTTFTITFLSSN